LKHTLGFFNQNLVAEYPYERSVADGVNVGYEVFRIRTRVSEDGSSIEAAGYQVPIRDRRTRQVRYRTLDEDHRRRDRREPGGGAGAVSQRGGGAGEGVTNPSLKA
jgi:type I site-specific restriction endonuclease